MAAHLYANRMHTVVLYSRFSKLRFPKAIFGKFVYPKPKVSEIQLIYHTPDE